MLHSPNRDKKPRRRGITRKLKRDGEESPQYEVVKRHLLNPKSVTMGQLYGEVNPVTQEWTDGLVPTLVRMSVHDESDAFNWIIFDGPVDALWIENMNSVMDDNRILTLPNGERIRLGGALGKSIDFSIPSSESESGSSS